VKYRIYQLNENFEAVLTSDTTKLLFENIRNNLSLQEIISNTRILANYFLGNSRKLEFGLKPIAVKELFETEKVKEAILTKSYRELGINKQTLSCMRQRLRDRGKIRLYNTTKWHFRNAED
jgi:hypothetical protein